MNESEEKRADALFHALSDRTRRDILRRVLAGEHSVSALAQGYDMSFAAVQKHVAVLERAGLVSKRRIGREALASGEVEAIRSVASLLEEFEAVWRGRIARIDDLLAERRDAGVPGEREEQQPGGLQDPRPPAGEDRTEVRRGRGTATQRAGDHDGETVLQPGWAIRDVPTGRGYATELGRRRWGWAGEHNP